LVDSGRSFSPLHGVSAMPSLFVGIDVSKEQLDVHHLPAGVAFQVKNTPAGHRKLVEHLAKLHDMPHEIRVVLESTGGLELPVAIALEEAGMQQAIIKPERARHYAKAHGQLAKNDAIDAHILALFAREIPLTITPLPTKELRHFRDLLDRRQQLLDMQVMEKNRLDSTHLKEAKDSLKRHLGWIKSELADVDKQLDERIAANPQWTELDRLLQSIPGLGPQASRVLIGRLPELGKVNHKVIANLVGVAPIANDSGKTEGPRHISGGRWQVRNVLYMCALSASKHNPVARDLYRRLVTRGKSGTSALIAVAHKLLTIANAIVAKKTPWRHLIVAEMS
jgi:transposase